MPPSFVWWKLVLLAHLSFNFAQSDHLLGNSLGIGTTTDALSFPPLDGFNINFLLIADDATNLPPSGELQHPSEVYSPNGQDPESSLMQTSNSKTNNDGCRVLGTTIDMLSSYTKKLLKRQGKFCPSPFLNLSPGAETEAGQQQQEALPVDVIQDLIAPAGAGSGLGKRPGQGKKKPGKDKKKGPPTNENRKLAPPEFEPEKKKCGNFAFDTYLVCGPLVGASPSLLDPLSVLLAGANPYDVARGPVFDRNKSKKLTFIGGAGTPPGCEDPDMTWCCQIVEKRSIQFNPIPDFSFAGYAYQADLRQPQSIFGASSAE